MRREAKTARVAVSTVAPDGSEHLLEVGFTPGEQRTLKVDGAAVDSLSTEPTRPLVSVFMPDRLSS